MSVHNVTPDDDYADDEELYNPITYERDRDEPAAGPGGQHDGWQPDSWAYPSTTPRPVRTPWAPQEPQVPSTPYGGADWTDRSWPPRRAVARPGGGRWLVLGAVVVALVAAGTSFALVAGNTPARVGVAAAGGRSGVRDGEKPVSPARPALTPPISLSGAQAVLARYTATNNTANARMSDALLATYETGTSYALDAGSYRQQAAMRIGAYPAFGPLRSRFYIPREAAASYPHWFAVQVTNALLAKTGKTRQPVNAEYVVFTQAGPGAPWLDAAEPYLPRGGASPAVTLDSAGLATAVAAGATNLALAPEQIASVTAQSLDGHGPVPDPGGLPASAEAAYWRPRLPKGTAITITQAPADATVFGLRTAGGGALLFYADTADLTMTAPRGHVLHIAVPGFYGSGQGLTTARLRYLEQFAAYDPPAGTAGPRVVAEYSGITS